MSDYDYYIEQIGGLEQEVFDLQQKLSSVLVQISQVAEYCDRHSLIKIDEIIKTIKGANHEINSGADN